MSTQHCFFCFINLNKRKFLKKTGLFHDTLLFEKAEQLYYWQKKTAKIVHCVKKIIIFRRKFLKIGDNFIDC